MITLHAGHGVGSVILFRMSDPGPSRDTIATKTWLDGQRRSRPINAPIVQSVLFQSDSMESLARSFQNGADDVYQRFGHPTARVVEEKLRALDGGEAAVLFGSGMGAIATVLFTVCRSSGIHVVAQRQIFGQTFTLLSRILSAFGVRTTFIDSSDPEQYRAAMRPGTRLVYIETPSNPMLQTTDIAAVAAVAHASGAILVVDGTLASPMLQQPLTLGADLVVHSATKFLAGHGDVMAGAAIGRRDLIAAIVRTQVHLGTVIDPHAAWLVLRGLKTIGLRVRKQSESALTVARFLASKSCVKQVFYPSLGEAGPGRTQMSAGGGLLSFVVAGGNEGARAFVDALRLIPIATSLGGVESVIEVPGDLDWSDQSMPASDDFALPLGLVRLSVGIEPADEIITDLERGLRAAAGSGR